MAGFQGRDAVTAAQSVAALRRLSETLALAGSALDALVKLTLYVGEVGDLAVFEQVRAKVLDAAQLPAFECVCVRGPGPVPEAQIQIEAIALV